MLKKFLGLATAMAACAALDAVCSGPGLDFGSEPPALSFIGALIAAGTAIYSATKSDKGGGSSSAPKPSKIERELAEERRENPPKAQRGGVGVFGGDFPEEGVSVADIPALFDFMVENKSEFKPEDFSDSVVSLNEANELVQFVVKEGEFELAEQIRDQFNLFLGSKGPNDIISPGISDIRRQETIDLEEAQATEDQRFTQGQAAIDALREINDRFFPEISDALGEGTDVALESSLLAETSALDALNSGREALTAQLGETRGLRESLLSGFDARAGEREATFSALNSGRIAALAQLRETRSLRAQVLDSFKNRSAQEFEALSSSIDFRHTNNIDDLRNRLANDPAFAGRPEAIEEQVRQERFAQRAEIGGIAADISSKQEQIRAGLDTDTARLVSNSAINAAGTFSNLAVQESNLRFNFETARTKLDIDTARLVAEVGQNAAAQFVQTAVQESNIRNQFSSRRLGVMMNTANADMSLKILEREGRVQEANAIRDLLRVYIPTAGILQNAMGLNISAEQIERANRFAANDQTVSAAQNAAAASSDRAASSVLQQQARTQQIGSLVDAAAGLFKPQPIQSSQPAPLPSVRLPSTGPTGSDEVFV